MATFQVILKFLSLLPEFWKQFQKWQAEAAEQSYQEYVAQREFVIKKLHEVKDADSAYTAARFAQSLLHRGKL